MTSDIWIEKYRPSVLSDVIGNPEITKRLEVIADEGNMPNLLLCVSLPGKTPNYAKRALRVRGRLRQSSV